MSSKPKYMEKFYEHFNTLSEEDRTTTIQRLKDVNGIPEDEDISDDIGELITQDMLFNIIDSSFQVDHILSDLVQNGIPHKFVEDNNLSGEQAIAFHNGVKLAAGIFNDILINSDVVSTFLNAIHEVQENEKQGS